MDRMDVRRLRDFAASQGLHLSSLIEATVLSALPRLMAEAALARHAGGAGSARQASRRHGQKALARAGPARRRVTVISQGDGA